MLKGGQGRELNLKDSCYSKRGGGAGVRCSGKGFWCSFSVARMGPADGMDLGDGKQRSP